MSKELQKEYVSPYYLLSHGFVQYKSPEEGDIHEIPFEVEDGSIHFREIEFDRRICVVTFTPRLDHDGYHYSVYFQDDAGCGFVCIPFCWWDLPIEYFEAVYYGIRGEKPKFNATSFENTYFEVMPDEPLNEKIEWSKATPENYDGKNNKLYLCILDEAGVCENQKPD